MFKYLYLLIVATAFGCGANTPHNKSTNNSNTELLVEYNNAEVHRRSKYLSQQQLNKLADEKKEMVIIFSAKWCNACTLTEKAIKQANLKIGVYYLNVEELWVQKLVVVLGLKRLVPTMLHVDKQGNIIDGRMGPGPIVTYLLTRTK